MAPPRGKPTRAGRTRPAAAGGQPAAQDRCGLCRKRSRKLTRTECCGHVICDDEDKYVIFSYARNSCHRNHRSFTLCGYHRTERHRGRWKTCARCRRSFPLEMYVYFATNEYNFETLKNPPSYEPTRCDQCGRVIVLSQDAYSVGQQGYSCGACMRF